MGNTSAESTPLVITGQGDSRREIHPEDLEGSSRHEPQRQHPCSEKTIELAFEFVTSNLPEAAMLAMYDDQARELVIRLRMRLDELQDSVGDLYDVLREAGWARHSAAMKAAEMAGRLLGHWQNRNDPVEAAAVQHG